MTRHFFGACTLGLSMMLPMQSAMAETKSLLVAGGCFWCVESDFEKVNGVLEVTSGYSGGTTDNPTYNEVSTKNTGHFEVARIDYDDEKVKLPMLLSYFWKTIDPTDPHGQFCDKGGPYKTAIFYSNEAEKTAVDASLAAVESDKPFEQPIVTEVLPAKAFYPAEDYHQDYYKKNPIRYKFYRSRCGRDARIKQLWGEVVSKKSQ